MRVEIGPKDVAKQQLMVVMRKEVPGMARKEAMDEAVALMTIPSRLNDFQRALMAQATERREANSTRGVGDYAQLEELVGRDAGFVYAGWCGSAECEAKVKDETKATIRCIPGEEFRSKTAPAKCAVCGRDAKHEVIWSKAY